MTERVINEGAVLLLPSTHSARLDYPVLLAGKPCGLDLDLKWAYQTAAQLSPAHVGTLRLGSFVAREKACYTPRYRPGASVWSGLQIPDVILSKPSSSSPSVTTHDPSRSTTPPARTSISLSLSLSLSLFPRPHQRALPFAPSPSPLVASRLRVRRQRRLRTAVGRGGPPVEDAGEARRFRSGAPARQERE
nr:unnamed protein product [Digitaria exilis]